MVAVKAHQAQAFLSAPGPNIRAVLFYGSDAGLVGERAQILAKAAAARFDPPGELIRLDDADLDADPDRLAVELGTVPMFGGPKIIRTTASRRVNAQALKPLIEGGRLYYRGRDAVALARSRSVEEVAALIWTGQPEDAAELFSGKPPDLPVRKTDLPPIERCQAILPLAGAADPAAWDLRPRSGCELRPAAGRGVSGVPGVLGRGRRAGRRIAAAAGADGQRIGDGRLRLHRSSGD